MKTEKEIGVVIDHYQLVVDKVPSMKDEAQSIVNILKWVLDEYPIRPRL